MKKNVARIIVGVVLFGSMVTNVCLWRANTSLKHEVATATTTYLEKYHASEKENESLKDELQKLSSEYDFLQTLHEIAQEENKGFRKSTLEVAKEQAKELGFNPNELDWFLNGEYHWCFWDYSEDLEDLGE